MKAPFKRRSFGDEYDRSVFLVASIGGIILIFLIRALGDFFFTKDGIGYLDIFAIFTAVLIITFYVIYIIKSKNRSGVSVDRASDNIYYLGLLFTLASLAYSLIKLSIFASDSESNLASSEQVLSLLPDFGLALFSTIAGIFGRIFLQQMRNDPLDVETEAREELGLAVRSLRETIGQVVTNLNSLSAQTNLTLTELNEKVSQTLEKTASENNNVVKAVSTDVGNLSSKLKVQVTEVTEFTTQSTQKFNEILDNMKEQFQGFEEIPKMLGQQFSTLSQELTTSIDQIKEVSKNQNQLTTELLGSVMSLKAAFSEDGFSKLSNIIPEFENRFNTLKDKLEDNEKKIEKSIVTIQDKSEGLKTATEKIDEYGKKIESSVQSVDEANSQYVNELSKAADILRSKTNNQ